MQEDNEHESHDEYAVNEMYMMNDEYAAISKKRMHHQGGHREYVYIP